MDTTMTPDIWSQPHITVWPHKSVKSWPNYEVLQSTGSHTQLCDMLSRYYATDAHFSAYHHGNAKRLSKAAIEKLDTSPRMRLVALDIDAPGKNRTGKWCDDFSRACERLIGNPYAYFTANGARLIWITDAPVEGWSEFYLRSLLSVFCVANIVADPACCDWTRLFRAPHATREGIAQRHGVAFGSVGAIGEWRECASDAEMHLAARLLATRGDAWSRVENAIWPSTRTHAARPREAIDWRSRAIDREILTIELATQGERNRKLFASAARCFRLEKGSPIASLDARIEAAGLSIGLRTSEVRATIRSARRAASRN